MHLEWRYLLSSMGCCESCGNWASSYLPKYDPWPHFYWSDLLYRYIEVYKNLINHYEAITNTSLLLRDLRPHQLEIWNMVRKRTGNGQLSLVSRSSKSRSFGSLKQNVYEPSKEIRRYPEASKLLNRALGSSQKRSVKLGAPQSKSQKLLKGPTNTIRLFRKHWDCEGSCATRYLPP